MTCSIAEAVVVLLLCWTQHAGVTCSIAVVAAKAVVVVPNST